MAMRSPSPAARIVRNPRVLGGEPIVEGTRVPVRSIVLVSRYAPDLDYICRAFALPPQAIQAALRYYEENRAEIDRYIADNESDDS
jgi:uncharacterized protein (DUF433 family)